MSRDFASAEVRRAVDARGGVIAFSKSAKLDPGTLGDFIANKQWPQARTRTKIEKALGWRLGRIQDLAEGIHPDVVVTETETPLLRLFTVAEQLPEDSQALLIALAEKLLPEGAETS